jgi:exopolysaccharide/PEP-CTERM locus tyrosine autokinase
MDTIQLDLARLGAAGIVTPDNSRSVAAEDFRLLKRCLLRNADSPERQRIVVTSALAGEGKTFCALCLAMSIALEADRAVVLVDADLASPGLMDLIGYVPEAGLIDVLMDGPARLPAVLLRTSLPQLTVLPAGRGHPLASELLASRAMRTLIDDVAGRYADRIVIFDAPPLLLTSEANELASHAGQVLLVVEAHRTPRAAVDEALRRLGQHDGISIVCNKAASEHPSTAGHES